MTQAIILFDGHCVLCSAGARFVLRHDKRGRFKLAAMESPCGDALARRFGVDPADPGTMLLVDAHRVLRESDAALGVARGLGWPWRALAALTIVPRPIRDAAYRWIARNRYRMFGRRETCFVPTAAERERML